MDNNIYDTLIIGTGPAGMTAAIYGKRAGLNLAIFEKNGVGGQTALTYEIKNFPGFIDINGFDLMQTMQNQVEALGVPFIYEEVIKIEKENGIYVLSTPKNKFYAKTVILALGAKPRNLGLEEEKQYLGKGVGYCAVCDGAFYRNKIVAVVGGGNSAFEDANYLSGIAKKVYLIHRREIFKAQDILVEALNEKKDKNVEYVLNSEVVGLKGENKLEQVELKNILTQEVTPLQLDGLFVAIGHVPDNELVDGLIEIDKSGFIPVNEKFETSDPNIYAVGDCIVKSLRQIITACADGASASTNINIKLKQEKKLENQSK